MKTILIILMFLFRCDNNQAERAANNEANLFALGIIYTNNRINDGMLASCQKPNAVLPCEVQGGCFCTDSKVSSGMIIDQSNSSLVQQETLTAQKVLRCKTKDPKSTNYFFWARAKDVVESPSVNPSLIPINYDSYGRQNNSGIYQTPKKITHFINKLYNI